MKKCMVLASVAGLAGMAWGVSSGIVGYQKLDVPGGGITWAVSTMPTVGVDLESQTLASFVLPTDEAFGGGDVIQLEIYDENGSLDGAYGFVDEESCELYGLSATGWYPLEPLQDWTVTDDDCANETVSLPAGKMVIITSGAADTTVTVPSAL